MNNHIFKSVMLSLGITLGTSTALPIAAQTINGADEATIEEVFVLGARRAYQGNFDDLESPTADQTMSEELLRQVGAI